MADGITIELDDRQVRQRLDQLLATVSNPAPIMRAVATELLAQTELAFYDEGPGWPQLKPATVKARKGRAHPILILSNALARSITSTSGRDFAQVGTNVPYAAVHQFGHTEKRIPARPFLPITAQRQLKPNAADAIMDVLRRAVQP